jgi:hypothetical protein
MLDAAYLQVGGRLAVNTEVRVDDAGKIHLPGAKAVEEPPSLIDLRNRTTVMRPRVDPPEVILDVMPWGPALAEAFIAVSGGRSRPEDLPTTSAACRLWGNGIVAAVDGMRFIVPVLAAFARPIS